MKRGEKEISIIDWQLSHLVILFRDLGKFLILNVNCSVEEQLELVRYFCSRLKEEGVEDLDLDLFLRDFRRFSYIIIVSAILAWNTLCEGKVPDSLDYLVNVDRLKTLYESWIDRIFPYLLSDDYFSEAENLALDARAFDQFLSDKYEKFDLDHLSTDQKESYSKIVIALKPWDDETPWLLIHNQISIFQFEGLLKWIELDKEGPVFGVGPFGMKIAKYSAVVDNLKFSLDGFLSDLEDQFADYLQAVELVSSDDLKDFSLSSLSSL